MAAYTSTTRNGPPSAGVFIAGDTYTDALGVVWLCTTPGFAGADAAFSAGDSGEVASIAMTTTPAGGSCAVQLIFKNGKGNALAFALAGLMYFSTSTGLALANSTSNAVLTNGAVQELVVGKADMFVTSAAGLLGFTVTAGTGSYYVSFVLPNGRIMTTAAIVCN